MTAQRPEHTPESLKVFKELQTIYMAWIALIVVFVFSGSGFAFFFGRVSIAKDGCQKAFWAD